MKQSSRDALEVIQKLLGTHCDVCENRPRGTCKKSAIMKEKYCIQCDVHKRIEVHRKKIK